jgi:macrolide-specific efflux system membrane fusion protein
MRALVALVAAVVVVAGVVWSTQRGGGSSSAKGEFVTAQRGQVAVTVGGIGHVNTLAGAGRLAVPSATPTSATGAGGGGSGAASSPSTASSASSGSTAAPADAVFPQVGGHVTRLLVRPGERVAAGQAIATVADDGTTQTNLLQARGDLSTARLELAQKQVQDPARGVPPTSAELASGRQAISAARSKLRQVTGPPLPADVAAAQLDLSKAIADQHSARGSAPGSVAAAQLAVASARQKLALVTGAADPAEVTAAQLDVAKATLDQETLLHPPTVPSAATIAAADAAIVTAQQRLADAQASGTSADIAAAQADLAKARSDRDALAQAAAPPTDAARTAAKLAVDAAQRKLDELVRPPAGTVSAARADLAKAEADLATQRAASGKVGLAAARSAVTAARRKLSQVVGGPTPDVVATARADVRKARADLAVLRQRGAPASATDLALSRLKVTVASQRVDLAGQLARRLTVLSNASGTVTSVLTTPGAAVDAATPLIRVQDLAHLVVTLDLSEFDVSRTRIGAPALISVDALGGKEFGGHVSDVALSGNDSGGVVNFPVIIALNSSRGRLRPGMSVSARIIIQSRRDVVRVPLDAIVDRGGRSTVTVKSSSGALVQRTVETGLEGKTFIEVRSGVRAGERVLIPSSGA